MNEEEFKRRQMTLLMFCKACAGTGREQVYVVSVGRPVRPKLFTRPCKVCSYFKTGGVSGAASEENLLDDRLRD